MRTASAALLLCSWLTACSAAQTADAGTGGGGAGGGSAGGTAGGSAGGTAGGSAGGTAGGSAGGAAGGSAGGTAGGTAGGSAGGAGGGAVDAGSSAGFAFVSTFLGGLTVFNIEPVSGRLDKLPGTPLLPGAHLYNVALHPSGAFVYTVNPDLGELSGFRVERSDGGLAPVPGSPLQIGGSPTSLAVHPSGGFVYVGMGASVGIYAVDAASGGLSAAPGSPVTTTGNAESIAPDPSGRFLYVSHLGQDGIEAFTVDGGSLSRVAASPFGAPDVQGGAMVFHPAGFLFNARFNLNGFAIDPVSGGLTKLAGSPFTTGVGSDSFALGLTIDPTHRFLYTVKNATNAVAGYSIASDGGLTPVAGSPVSGISAPYSVATDPSGKLLYVGTDFGSIAGFAIDSDGGLAPLATSPFPVSGLQPELVVSPR